MLPEIHFSFICDYVFVYKCSSCHCLIHDVMLCSQNKDLWDACRDGNVAGVKRLLSQGADPNHHSTGRCEVSCV